MINGLLREEQETSYQIQKTVKRTKSNPENEKNHKSELRISFSRSSCVDSIAESTELNLSLSPEGSEISLEDNCFTEENLTKSPNTCTSISQFHSMESQNTCSSSSQFHSMDTPKTMSPAPALEQQRSIIQRIAFGSEKSLSKDESLGSSKRRQKKVSEKSQGSEKSLSSENSFGSCSSTSKRAWSSSKLFAR